MGGKIFPDAREPMATQGKALTWIGWILTLLVCAALGFSASMKLMNPPEFKDQWAGKFGYPEDTRIPIAVTEIACAILFVIPQTSILGAVLLTGYLGGATATHVRVSDGFAPPIIIGAIVWLAILCREPRMRALLPLRWRASTQVMETGAVPPPKKKRGVLVPLLILVVVLVGGFLGVAALQPNEFRVMRTTIIAAPPEAIFPNINDLHEWQTWSPWAKLDPAAKNTFEGAAAGEGAEFSWSGNSQVGAGKMTIIQSHPNDFVRIKLDFEKPMKATDTADFSLTKKDGDETLVTWTMYGPNLFMGKVMGLVMNMDKMVGSQFEQGLANLKEKVEKPADAESKK